MTTLLITLLIAGLIFPTISLLTVIVSLLHQWRHKKYSSQVFIPFIGPLLLTIWVMLAHKPLWLIPVVWITDIGTLAFCAVIPQLITDWWRTSSFTRLLSLKGAKENQNAIITLHSTGHYLLKKNWCRPSGQTGIIALSEPGTYTKTDIGYALISHAGIHRILRRMDEGTYLVEENDLPNDVRPDYSLNGWLLQL